jgi:hypothetical protein
MTDKTTDESAPAPENPPKKSDELTEQQLEAVAGATGRQVDCEGYTYLTGAVLKTPATTALKSD